MMMAVRKMESVVVEPGAHRAAALEEDAEGRQDDGEDDVDAGRRAVRHLFSLVTETHLTTRYSLSR
jgi:hypothetical protein